MGSSRCKGHRPSLQGVVADLLSKLLPFLELGVRMGGGTYGANKGEARRRGRHSGALGAQAGRDLPGDQHRRSDGSSLALGEHLDWQAELLLD